MWKKIVYGSLVLLIGAMSAAPIPPAGAAAGSCASVRIPVALLPGRPADHSVSGKLCVPGSWQGKPPTVDVLVHGATYSGSYWDWPQDPGRYSYVKKTMDAGRAAFTYDRPGTGASSRPPSLALNVAAEVHVLHQVIEWLRAHGDYAKVTVIGHSAGSIIAMTAAADRPGDLDRLVITGMVHPPGLGPDSPALFGSFYPAPLDPLFLGRITDAGYLTTRPGTRGGSFYDAGTADPSVVAYDEGHKDITSATEITDALTRLAVPAGLNDTNRIRVPVLIVMGQHDTLLCGLLLDCSSSANVLANERPYYSAAPGLDAETVPGTGHSLTLHPSAGQSFNVIDQWIRAH